MEIKNYASKLVKPSKPTPSTLRRYNISVFDEQVANINTNLILYYTASSQNDNKHFDIFSHNLEISLSKTLTDFYPFSGRYIRNASLVNCSDQGALYVQAKANFRLSEFLGLAWDLKLDMLQDLHPCDFGEAGEIDDPMVSVKVTKFECGGVVIGMSFSHKISDMSTMCIFINNWSARTKSLQIGVNNEVELEKRKYYPDFSLAQLFPKRGLIDNSPRVPRSRIGMKNQVQKFIFTRNAISKIREKINMIDDNNRPSKVQIIVALLWKALVGIDKANGQSKIAYAYQVVNMRNKVVPKLADNSFGNFVTFAIVHINPNERDNVVDLQGFVKLLHESIKDIDNICAGLMTHGDTKYELLSKRLMENSQDSSNKEIYYFTSWCRFSFYGADFGLGKPIWRSPGKFPGQNLVTMMDYDQEGGEGIEAWVHLDENRMSQLEQDPDIMAYAI
uniref:pelargonidin 3-O-(6-caffeoylglucoside) 5-O-(6-O-malonylglucoside) 4'''-malonyltransferase-like n=1 Tax=Erigeron canadensis TaxID=72917 RepID=UPI001CB95B15|nr:pelargonidin 3-O-(6-caffeoylglucoside) 5-O-(6-O-malonylglucoside) 4'''-malonyltransferase-like [Erigeron canadensis]